eukprot:CAMPEP_0116939612 /NCGR_PEP_ID=MMETSP0467-20121206/32842_1 /TAXON_ID=283647 /ORGANISM="Mesodinium pulex, Strain SPMC105" /LENGTH=75 /DNA_ID=CAMNT_0004621929 /DNA_START=1306 /DNA_END=1533 /DNA_ORIENTATION=+
MIKNVYNIQLKGIHLGTLNSSNVLIKKTSFNKKTHESEWDIVFSDVGLSRLKNYCSLGMGYASDYRYVAPELLEC